MTKMMLITLDAQAHPTTTLDYSQIEDQVSFAFAFDFHLLSQPE